MELIKNFLPATQPEQPSNRCYPQASWFVCYVMVKVQSKGLIWSKRSGSNMLYTKNLSTSRRDEMKDITREVEQVVRESGVQNGTVLIYCPHTTAGIAINENADPDVKHDVLLRLNEVYPWEHPEYRHAEGNTASHLKSITTGPSQTVIIHEGRLVLGRWQGIYFCEFDGPRQREYFLKIMEG